MSPDRSPVRVLHLEDDDLDADLVRSTLAADGLACEIRRVDSREAFEAALVADTFDLILSDYNLPTFDGLTAQSTAKRFSPDTPFIFLSGTLGEEIATQCLKDGATDCVLKQRMSRLPSSVRRAVQEARERADRRRAEEELRRLTVELEARVRARSAELETLNATLEGSERDLQEARRRLQSILDFSPAAITVKDTEGRYVVVNRKAARLLDLTPADLIGRTVHDLMPPRLADAIRADDVRVAQEQQALDFEEVAQLKDGIHIFASSKFPLFDQSGALEGVGAIAQDVTDRKHAEDGIKLARLEAMRASQAKSEFLSRMSHELRTPLNAILGFAQLFDVDRIGRDEAENVRQILAAGRHLLDLINEVLDITRIESGHLSLSPEPVAVADVVKGAVDLILPLAAGRGVRVVPPDAAPASLTVLADRLRLGQVLLNLLSNAVKYNRPDGLVTMACERTASGRVRISVTDTGHGIPPAKLKLLFQPFERLDAGQSPVEGTGLGLALSRALVQAMDGTIGVESVIDRGSTFWVELAAAGSSAAPVVETSVPDERSAPAAATGAVVYVEDNPSNVRLVERVLARRPGVTLHHAPLGATALDLVREHRPGLILLDLHLPDMPGDEVLRRLRGDPASRHVPVVVLTADATAGLERRLKSGGALACLTKPIDIAQLLRVLDDVLGKATHDHH